LGFPFSIESKSQNSLHFFGTLRGRAGFTPVHNLLIYGTGGFAYGKVNSSASFSDVPRDLLATPAFGSASAVLSGWTAGGGFESMFGFAPNWSLKVEYLYYDLGKLSYNLNTSTITSTGFGILGVIDSSVTTEFRGSIVHVGLNYKFN
jgi:outer membrane immunogenic protein